MCTCCLGKATHLPPVPFQLSAHPAPVCSILFLISRLFSLLVYSLQILFKLPSSPFLLIFHPYPLLPSLNFFLFFHLNFTAQDSAKLAAFWGASWGLLDFSPLLQTVLPFAISVLSFLFAFLPSVILWAWLSSNISWWEKVLAHYHLVRYPGDTFNSYAVRARQKKRFCFQKAAPQDCLADLNTCERTTDS